MGAQAVGIGAQAVVALSFPHRFVAGVGDGYGGEGEGYGGWPKVATFDEAAPEKATAASTPLEGYGGGALLEDSSG